MPPARSARRAGWNRAAVWRGETELVCGGRAPYGSRLSVAGFVVVVLGHPGFTPVRPHHFVDRRVGLSRINSRDVVLDTFEDVCTDHHAAHLRGYLDDRHRLE